MWAGQACTSREPLWAHTANFLSQYLHKGEQSKGELCKSELVNVLKVVGAYPSTIPILDRHFLY